MVRKIAVFTGSRAEYGLLRPLLRKISNDGALSLQLIVSGSHLSPEFGYTCSDIERDGFDITDKIEMLLSSDTPVGTAKAMGVGMMGYADSLARLRPDLTVVLGDRFEAFSFAVAAAVLRIPAAHIHGGELTAGSLDECFRHAITKMSAVHFTAAEEYRRRVIQLGEDPQRVFNVGALGIDCILELQLLDREHLEKDLNFRFNRCNLLVTYHPVTAEPGVSGAQFRELLEALDILEDTSIIFTKANADSEGRTINQMIDDFTTRNQDKSISFVNMGQLRYFSALSFVDAVLGNSSSGIIEAPSFRIGTVNIGDRQKGRIKAESVIDCSPDRASISEALQTLYSEAFQNKVKEVRNPYGEGNSAEKIINIIKSFDLCNIGYKIFYDIEFNKLCA